MRYVLALFLIALIVAPASACFRCGRYYSSCRYVAPVYKAPYIPPTNVFVVQNSYPAPLVAQGSSQVVSTGSYQAAVLPFIDVNAYFSNMALLNRAVVDTGAVISAQTAAVFQRGLELQAPVAQTIAAGTAATMVLQAAGLDPAHNTGGTQSAVVINRDSAGRIQVLPLNPQQLEQPGQQYGGQGGYNNNGSQPQGGNGYGPPQQQNGQAPSPQPAGYPALTQYCFKCHGPDTVQPKGNLVFSGDPNIAKSLRDRYFKIVRQVSSAKMPPTGAPQPTKEERAAILNEVEQIILTLPEE